MTLPRFVLQICPGMNAGRPPYPRRARHDHTTVTTHRKTKKYVIARSNATWQSPGTKSRYHRPKGHGRGPYYSSPRVGKSHVPPGDSHVASLLGMTYFFTFPKYRYRRVVVTLAAGRETRPLRWPPSRRNKGRVKTLPYGFCWFTWYVHPRDCPHHLSGLVRNDVLVVVRRDVEYLISHIPYLISSFTIHYQLSTHPQPSPKASRASLKAP